MNVSDPVEDKVTHKIGVITEIVDDKHVMVRFAKKEHKIRRRVKSRLKVIDNS